MAVIFFASTGSFSASNTSRIIRPLLLWLNPDISEAALLRAHHIVRKAAHFSEYAVLAALAARAFLSSSNARLKKLWHLAALALVVSYALLDEYHQTFVPTRTGTPYDSLIDSCGGAFALLVVALVRARRRRASA
jgi:MYXO-CTERM domain-containing protein